MSRRRNGLPIHGWIVLDKPSGIGSTPALAKVRRAAGAAKAGHGGTLDPLASGVLPVALGEATKTVQWAISGRKRYAFTLRWGFATETEDAAGAVVETSPNRPSEAAIIAALPAFVGQIDQVPSRYSALLIEGKRAYDLARAGIDIALEARSITIDALDLIGLDDADHARFEVTCGKGTYVRALARDLALALGTVGHLSALRRLQVGRFDLGRSISMALLDELGHTDGLSKHLLPVETALDDIPALALTEAEALELRHGRSVPASCLLDKARIGRLGDGTVVSALVDGRLVAIAKLDAGALRPVRVFNL